MTEYIKREAVEEMLENAQMVSDGEYSGYCTEDVCIDKIPTADVAPKSEYAREIFDGLEKLFYKVMGTDGIQAVRFNPADYADFKKKYTEDA